MASVPENLEKILQARYGEEVRGAIHDSIESIYNYTADDHIDNRVMDIGAQAYSGHLIAGRNITIDRMLVDTVHNTNVTKLKYGMFITNNGRLSTGVEENKGVVTDYYSINVEEDADGVYVISASRMYKTRVIGVYDSNGTPLGVYDEFDDGSEGSIKPPEGVKQVEQTFDHWMVPKASILLKYPSASKIRFGSYSNNPRARPLRLIVGESRTKNDLSSLLKYFDDNVSTIVESRYSVGSRIFSKDDFTAGNYITYNGDIIESSDSSISGYISIDNLPELFHVKLGRGYQTRAIHFYDYYGHHLGCYDHIGERNNISGNEVIDEILSFDKILYLYPETKLIRFCNYRPALDDNLVSIDNMVLAPKEAVDRSNVLFGKKYVICGDSFSAEITSNNRHPYGKFITDRNSMEYVNLAIAGTTMSTDVESNNFCQYRYKKVPLDADYITLCYGLNEESRIPDHVGTKTSTELDILWGAWNFSLEYLITNIPYAKIGIIIPDAWCSQTMHDTLAEIAEWWAIPYLDLKEDPQVPMGLGGRLPAGSVSDKAKELRQAAFAASDNHPNEKAHEYRSTYIENFLRSL